MKQFVFIDEMGSNLALARLFGRAEPGLRVVDQVPSARGQNVSTIGALAFDGVRAAFGLPPISYVDPTITAGVTVIKASQLQQIRDGVK